MKGARGVTAPLGSLLLLLAGGPASPADTPQVTVSLVETDPASPATLHGTDNVYVHVHYSASAPIKIWVRPYFQGHTAAAMTMGSPVYPAGEGEAFGWFAFRGAGRVDSIHLEVATERSGYPFTEQAFPADYSWDGAPGAWHEPAAWVAPFQEQEKQREKEAYQRYAKQPLGVAGDIALAVFGVIVLASLAVCFLWPLWALLRWRGRWRVLAAIPLLFVALWVIKDIVEISADPTSHNLLPFEVVEAAVPVAIFMSVLWVLRRRAFGAVS
ncbi:MAG TPA: hypothetical protein VLV25_03980 [Steroidobacteraceae bacterium]|nr:hypothetical protein [Steroidobacteraceae bacterium]